MSFANCVEQEEIWYVEVRDRVTHNIITDVCVGNDYIRAEMEKDQLDLAWDDGSTYTVITSEFEDC